MDKFTYVDEKKKRLSVNVDKYVSDHFVDANNKYETSRKYILEYVYDIWNRSIKDYMMYTGDRASYIKEWQSNVALGLVRSTIDAYQSFLVDNPFAFTATGLNKQGFENRQFVQDAINYVADVTEFRDNVNDTMIEGLVMGNYGFQTVYLSTPKKRKSIELVNGVPYEVEFEYKVTDVPFTRGVDIYKLFPDPYSGPLRYVTHRDVVSSREFQRLFYKLIRSKDNKSPLKTDKFIELLAINSNGADFQDFGSVRTQVFKSINDSCRENDSLPSNYGSSRMPSANRVDQDSAVTENLIEYKLTVDDNKWMLIANNYPVYVGKNPYGFINYEYGNAYHTLGRFSEGLAFLMKDYEEVGTSFLNAYIDGAKSIIHPNLIADKNMIVDPNQLKNAGPGDIIWTDGPANQASLGRLDKGTISDMGTLDVIGGLGQRISGVSDYNSGVSARERVATAVSALVESTNRRISGYVKRFSRSLGRVGETWLGFMQKYWTTEQWTYVMLDGEQVPSVITNKQLKGALRVSLSPDTFLGVSKESEIKRLADIFNLLAPTGIINSSEWAKELIRASGKNPIKFIADENVIIPANKIDDTKVKEAESLIGKEPPMQEDMATDEQQFLAQSTNTQIDLGNGGEGQP